MSTPSTSNGSTRQVVIIGAGAAGLATARRLLAVGVEPIVLEAGSHVGGLWKYDNDNGASVAYASLHVNSETSATAFPGFSFPAGSPVFADHRLVSRYLDAFADSYDIRRCIRFRRRVTAVRRRPDGVWSVQTHTGDELRADDLVVATGHQAVPAHPEDVRQGFTGQYLHVSDYRTPERFAGQRVLVIGLGNSGVDVASDLVPFAASVHNAVRSPVLVMPRMVFGVPTSRVLSKIYRVNLPWVVQRQLQRSIARIYHGRMEQWGLRTPSGKTHPATSLTYMPSVAYGRIVVMPGIGAVTGQKVNFVDGREEEFDTIIAATGYQLNLDFLGPCAPVSGRRLHAYKRIVHTEQPGLYFVGFFNANGAANLPLMDLQAQYVAALVSGRLQRSAPGHMQRDIDREHAFIERTFPAAARYGLELAPRRYREQMSALMGGVEIPLPVASTVPGFEPARG